MELSCSDNSFSSLSAITVPAKRLTPPIIPPMAKAFGSLLSSLINSIAPPKPMPKAKELSNILLQTLDLSILLI